LRLQTLHLRDFRSYEAVDLEFPDGLTVITGPNGQGKTNLLEAVSFLATLSSFRGAPTDAVVRVGHDRAIVRGETSDGERSVLIEAELVPAGRTRVKVNRQRLSRARDLLGIFRASIFSPDDLMLVKGGPSGRRRLMDEALSTMHTRHDAARSDVDRVLRQRNALLKQARGRLDESSMTTLDVWDEKLAEAGGALVRARRGLVGELAPAVTEAFSEIAGYSAELLLSYRASWEGELGEAFAASREDDVRRGVTLVGPHRDDLEVVLDGLPARTHGSQGEQRALALAMRLALHRIVTERTGSSPVLLLDDVFSELDPERARALVGSLPTGQCLLTCADVEPADIEPVLRLHVRDGRIE